MNCRRYYLPVTVGSVCLFLALPIQTSSTAMAESNAITSEFDTLPTVDTTKDLTITDPFLPVITEPLETEATNNEETLPTPTEEVKEESHRRYYSITGDDGNTYTMAIEHQDFVQAMCDEYGISNQYELMLALSYHESRYNPNALSKTNDYGYMQINKCNHGWLKKQLGVKNFLDPYDNIRSGVYMYSKLLSKYGNQEQALVAYNAGENYARKHSSTRYSKTVITDLGKLTLIQ